MIVSFHYGTVRGKLRHVTLPVIHAILPCWSNHLERPCIHATWRSARGVLIKPCCLMFGTDYKYHGLWVRFSKLYIFDYYAFLHLLSGYYYYDYVVLDV